MPTSQCVLRVWESVNFVRDQHSCAQGLRDVKVIAREQEKVVAASDSDAGPPIDLSILEQRQLAKVSFPAAKNQSAIAPVASLSVRGKGPSGALCARRIFIQELMNAVIAWQLAPFLAGACVACMTAKDADDPGRQR